MSQQGRKALGRGLGALIPQRPVVPPAAMTGTPTGSPSDTPDTGDRVVEVPVDKIRPSRFQPRTVFNEEPLKELAESIREKGVIQPVILSKKHDGYELIAGERRWRASKMLGYERIPAIVKVVRDADALEMALIENIQRENLSPMEEAHAYERLLNEFAFTQEGLAKKVGKSRSAVANMLRLLKLPSKIQDDLADGRLTMGHARALLSLDSDDQRLEFRDRILSTNMNVRQVEGATRSAAGKGKPPKKGAADPNIERLAISIERRLGVKTKIALKGNGGTITLAFADDDELDRIITIIGVR
ncbi:MAG: ParB/RepB/Spo0J family partition protein [Nitrospinae bacterium]|nr:ParB/RepB/Spo0J family partition protein [Nitrospinota bacterium]